MTNIEAITAQPATSDGRAKAALRKATAAATTPPVFGELFRAYRAAEDAAAAALSAWQSVKILRLTDEQRAKITEPEAAVPLPPELLVPHTPSASFPEKVHMVMTYSDGRVVEKDCDAPPIYEMRYEMRYEQAILEHCEKSNEDPKPRLEALTAWKAAKLAAAAQLAPEYYGAQAEADAREREWHRKTEAADRALRRLPTAAATELGQVELKLRLILKRENGGPAATGALRSLHKGTVPALREVESGSLAGVIQDLYTLARRWRPTARAGTATDPVLAERWASIAVAFEAAVAEYQAAEEAEGRIDKEAAEATPMPPNLQKPRSTPGCWMTEREITDRHDLNAGERIELLQVLLGWHEARRRAGLDLGAVEAGDRTGEAGEVLDALYEEIESLCPCDTRSLLLKHRVALGWPFTSGSQDDQMEELTKILVGQNTTVSSTTVSGATMLLDLLEMVNPTDPMLAVREFDAGAWADEFESYPGHQVGEFRVSRSEPFDGPSGWHMLDGLARWQKVLINQEGRIREDARTILVQLRDWNTHTWGNDIETTRSAMVSRYPDISEQGHARAWEMAEAEALKFPMPDPEEADEAKILETAE